MIVFRNSYQCGNCRNWFNQKLHEPFYYVCAKCKSENICTNNQAKNISTTNTIEEDLSPLMLGLYCRIDSKVFEIIGRIKCIYKEGYYRNQWLLSDHNESFKWILEAYTEYALVEYYSFAIQPNEFKNELAGNNITLAEDQDYCIEAISEIKKIVKEGYTPAIFEISNNIKSYDLSASNGNWALIDIVNTKVNAYFGKLVTLKELNFDNYRQLNG